MLAGLRSRWITGGVRPCLGDERVLGQVARRAAVRDDDGVGAQLGHASRKGKGKSLGKQAQGMLSDAVVRLWKMQRERAKARREPNQE